MTKWPVGLFMLNVAFAQTLVDKAEQAKRQRLVREEALLSQMPKIATSDLVGMAEVTDALMAFKYTYYFYRDYVAFFDQTVTGSVPSLFSFYDNPELKGSPVFDFDGTAIRIKGTAICASHIPKKKIMTRSWVACQSTGCRKSVSEKLVEKYVLDLNNRGFYELSAKTKACRYGSSFRPYLQLEWDESGWYSSQATTRDNLIVLKENGKSYYASLPTNCGGSEKTVCRVSKEERSQVESRYLETLPKSENSRDHYYNSAKKCLVNNGEHCWDWFRYPKNGSSENEVGMGTVGSGCATGDCFDWDEKLKEEFWECLRWKPFFGYSKGREMFCTGYLAEVKLGKTAEKFNLMRFESISHKIPQPPKNVRLWNPFHETNVAEDKEWVWSLED